MEVNIDATSVQHLEEFFQELSDKDQRKIFLTAYRKSVKPLLADAKAAAPVGKTGNLRNSIGTSELPNEIAILAGTLKRRKGWHGHLVENGTVERFRRTKSGKQVSTGKMVGTHFFEKAYNANEEAIVNSVNQEYYKAIDNAIVKYNKASK